MVRRIVQREPLYLKLYRKGNAILWQLLWQQEMAWRNRPLTDEELDQLLPGGYRIVVPPESYVATLET